MRAPSFPMARVGSTARAGSAEPLRVDLNGLSLAGFHRLAVWHWPGQADRVPVICVHGLTRQGRDFDVLARHLSACGRPVWCPDLPGRGRSEWLRDPEQYHLLQYGADLNAVIARVGAQQVDWVGTSLGGLIGMMLAAQPGSPIRRLVLNDIGPYISAPALRRLGAYVGSADRRFASLEAAEQRLRERLAPFGDLDDEEWHHLTLHSVKPDGQGGFEFRDDPDISRTYRRWQYISVSMWPTWNAIRCPVLVIRGADSDFLAPDTLAQMMRSGPAVSSVEIAGCGHAPTLTHADQISAVMSFLEAAPQVHGGPADAGLDPGEAGRRKARGSTARRLVMSGAAAEQAGLASGR